MTRLLTTEERESLRARLVVARHECKVRNAAHPWHGIFTITSIESALLATELLPQAIEALDWLLGDPDPIQRFDNRAEEFYRETRMMAPGKDMPAAMGGTDDYDERRRAWQAWIDKKTTAAREVLAAYRAALPQEAPK